MLSHLKRNEGENEQLCEKRAGSYLLFCLQGEEEYENVQVLHQTKEFQFHTLNGWDADNWGRG